MKRTGLAVALLVLALAAAAEPIPEADRRSGFDFMTPDSQAMQRDDTANPGMLWVRQGEALWQRREGMSAKACADCHATETMRGTAARYPAFDEAQRRPLTLEQRIQGCREKHQQAEPLAWESQPLLALTAFVAHQSRGRPVSPPADPRLDAFRENGRASFERRQGVLNLSCANCHDDNWGKRLGGSAIPQGHANGYPLYRLEWQSVGSLQRRLRNCLTGIRAETYPYGAPELVELELFLATRGRGLPVEAPAVRP